MADQGASIEQVLAGVRPKTSSAWVCLDGGLLGEHERLEHLLAEALKADAVENRLPKAPEIARQIGELEERIKQAEVEFSFVSIGQKAWTDLLVKHPPAEEDAARGADFGEGFPQAAVAASCTSPKMTEAQAHELFESFTVGQWEQLWAGCLRANVAGADVPFSLAASAVLRVSETRSEQPGTTESPAASS